MGLFIAAAYAVRLTEGKPDKDALYQYSVTANALVQYAFVLIVMLAIAGFDRELIALRRPRSWPRAAGLAAIVAVGLVVSLKLLDLVFHAGDEQGLVPKEWDSSRAGAYFANFAVIVIVAPFVEELTYRGLGFSLLEPFGEIARDRGRRPALRAQPRARRRPARAGGLRLRARVAPGEDRQRRSRDVRARVLQRRCALERVRLSCVPR